MIDLLHINVNAILIEKECSKLHKRNNKHYLCKCHDPLYGLNNQKVLAKKHS